MSKDNLKNFDTVNGDFSENKMPNESEKKLTNKQKIKELAKILSEDEDILEVIKKDKKNKKVALILFIVGIGLSAVGFFLFIIFSYFGLLTYEFLQNLALVIFVIGVIFIVVSVLIVKKSKKEKYKNLITVVNNFKWPWIYTKASEMWYGKTHYKFIDAKIVAHNYLEKTSDIPTNVLVCEYKNTTLYYRIYSEIVKYETEKKITYKTFVSEFLTTKSGDFKFPSLMTMVKKHKKNKPTFVSESIVFNDKFDVFAESEFDATKFFRPALIEKFFDLKINPNFEKMVLLGDEVKTYEKWQAKGLYPWVELATWEPNSNHQIYLENIASKIFEDIIKLDNILSYSQPFLPNNKK